MVRHQLAAVLLAAAPMSAAAIPAAPDPCHTAACTPWSSVPIGLLNPATDQHQHRNDHSLFGVAGSYKTYAAWDSNQYRYNAVADRSLVKGLDGQDFGHGYMGAQAATYWFDPSVPNWAVGLIFGKVEGAWEGAVNEDNVNTNGVPTRTRIDFTAKGGAVRGDVKIEFKPGFMVGGVNNQQPYDFPEDSDIPDDGSPVPGGGPQNGRDGVLAYWTPATRTLTFNSLVNWYRDDTGNAGDDVDPTVQGLKFDFMTTALHEWGHVLGLDHPDNANAGSTMFPRQARRAFDPNGIMRGFDGGTLDGAKNLYTIAIPEPQTGLLFGCGLAALAALTVRRRRV